MQAQGQLSSVGASRGVNLRRLTAALVAAAMALLVAAPLAAAEKPVVNEIGSSTSGSGDGVFNIVRGIAVNHSGAGGVAAGTVYAVDASNFRIQQFSPAGAFVRTWGYGVKDGSAEFQICTSNCLKGANSNGAGGLASPIGIAVDQATGNVFVTNATSRRVSIYGPTGIFHGAFGWGAINGGAALQFCTTATGCGTPGASAPTSGNIGGGQFGAQIGNLAIDPAGNIVVADKWIRRVSVFKQVRAGNAVTGVEFLRAFGWGVSTGAAEFQVCTASPCKASSPAGTGLGQFGNISPAEVATDSAGNIFVFDNGNKRIQKFNNEGVPQEAAFGAAAISAAFGTGTLHNLAVEPDSDYLLIAGSRSTEANSVAVLELDDTGAHVDTHGKKLTQTSVAGLAAAGPSIGGNIYTGGNTGNHRIFVLNDTKPTIDPPTAITAHGGDFSGEVVSKGIQVNYRFEFSTDGQSWVKFPQPDAVAGTDPGSIAVSETVTGLKADTTYRARLVADRPSGGGAVASDEIVFKTGISVPTVGVTFASMVGADNARLAAYVNPENAAASYFVEYGRTASYGSTAPAPSSPAQPLRKGSESVAASLPISGLEPGTTYHFRIVVRNEHGTTQGPDATFTTLPPAPAAEQRAYEMASTPQKYGADVIAHGNSPYSGNDFSPYSSVEGDRVVFTSYGTFANVPSHAVYGVYMTERGEEGWTTKSLMTPADGANYSSPLLAFFNFSPDLTRWTLVGPAAPALAPGASLGSFNTYNWDPATGTYQLTSPGMPPELLKGASPEVVSEDYRRVVLSSNVEGLTPDTPAGGKLTLYVWDADSPGELTYLPREPGTNLPMSGDNRVATPAITGAAPSPALTNSGNRDASALFFYNAAHSTAMRSLYLRLIDDEETLYISKSERTPVDPNGQKEARFQYAAANGSVAFFTSAEKLTDDATTGPASSGTDLYRYDVEARSLSDITVDAADANGAEVQGVVGGSQAGDRLYFVAKGALAAGAVAGENNLYLWSDDGSEKGTIRFIAGGVDPVDWQFLKEIEYRRLGRVTADGTRVLFHSSKRLTPYDNAGQRQVYLYDAEADRLQCASCNPSGAPASAGATAMGSGDVQQAARTLTNDGRYAFFTTTAPLVDADVNGLEDVYQFDSARGELSLISPGTGPIPAVFFDASADGSDVFFGTRQRLVRIDTDVNVDIYDARVGGGIAAQNPAPVTTCSGEDCRPAPLGPPPVPAAGSAAYVGAGNLAAQRKTPKKAKKKSQAKKKQKAKKKRKAQAKRGKRAKKRAQRSGRNAKTNVSRRDGRRG